MRYPQDNPAEPEPEPEPSGSPSNYALCIRMKDQARQQHLSENEDSVETKEVDINNDDAIKQEFKKEPLQAYVEDFAEDTPQSTPQSNDTAYLTPLLDSDAEMSNTNDQMVDMSESESHFQQPQICHGAQEGPFQGYESTHDTTSHPSDVHEEALRAQSQIRNAQQEIDDAQEKVRDAQEKIRIAQWKTHAAHNKFRKAKGNICSARANVPRAQRMVRERVQGALWKIQEAQERVQERVQAAQWKIEQAQEKVQERMQNAEWMIQDAEGSVRNAEKMASFGTFESNGYTVEPAYGGLPKRLAKGGAAVFRNTGSVSGQPYAYQARGSTQTSSAYRTSRSEYSAWQNFNDGEGMIVSNSIGSITIQSSGNYGARNIVISTARGNPINITASANTTINISNAGSNFHFQF